MPLNLRNVPFVLIFSFLAGLACDEPPPPAPTTPPAPVLVEPFVIEVDDLGLQRTSVGSATCSASLRAGELTLRCGSGAPQLRSSQRHGHPRGSGHRLHPGHHRRG
ncbi:MAG: hypothetical protein AAF645_21510, partial [Myxococcota bacterium]